jgi:succinoglycan biosynthesis protein ExoW
VDPFPILVVDDESPVPAQEELRELLVENQQRIKILRRSNGGPGAARNTGLEQLAGAVRYVAFLDSDDEWTDHHVANALAVLERGYDFYFSDHYQLEQQVSAFVRANRLALEDHPKLVSERPFHEFRGNMIDQIVAGNVIGTSTVVYRLEKFPDVRFRQEYRRAGEDYLFWLELAARTTRIAFSTAPECRYGRGVNVFSASAWGSDEHGTRLHEEMKYRKAAATHFPLSSAARYSNQRAIRRLREGFIADALHRLRHQERIDGRLLARQLRLDPWTLAALLPVLIRRTLIRNH